MSFRRAISARILSIRSATVERNTFSKGYDPEKLDAALDMEFSYGLGQAAMGPKCLTFSVSCVLAIEW